MRGWKRPGFMLTLFVSWFASPSIAQNLLSNPDFDTNNTGWPGSAFDATRDVANDAGSGSGLVTNSAANALTGLTMTQCVDGIVAGTSYNYGGSVFLTREEDTTTGNGRADLSWFSGAGCVNANFLGGSPSALATTIDAWTPINNTATAPATAGSVVIFGFIQKTNAGGTLRGNWDNMFFQLAPTPTPTSTASATTTSTSTPTVTPTPTRTPTPTLTPTPTPAPQEIPTVSGAGALTLALLLLGASMLVLARSKR